MPYCINNLRTIFVLGLVIFNLASPVGATAPTVLFDQGHGQLFRFEGEGELDLSTFAGLFQSVGVVPAATDATLDTTSLATARALIISGPFAPFSESEIEAITAFVARGGKLAIMLHIGPPAARLLEHLGVNVANGVVRESDNVIDGDALNFSVAQLGTHSLFSGIDWFNIYGSWPLLSVAEQTRVGAETGAQAWVDLNRNGKFDAQDVRQPFAVIVAGNIGKGEVLVFGDDAIFQNRFLTGNNLQLARNLVHWLTE